VVNGAPPPPVHYAALPSAPLPLAPAVLPPAAPHAADNDDDALARRLELLKRGD